MRLPSTEATELANAARLAPWAAAAYGSPAGFRLAERAAKRVGGRVEHFAVYDAHGVVAQLPTCTIIAIAGTDDKADWRTNLDVGPYCLRDWAADHQEAVDMAWGGIAFHTGFLQVAGNVVKRLTEMYRRFTRPIWIAGHSLGGAVASILPYIWGRVADAKVFTFGAPRVVHWSSVPLDRDPRDLVRTVAVDDLVPQVPLGYGHGPCTLKILRGNGEIRNKLNWRDRFRRVVRRFWCACDPIAYTTRVHSMAVYVHRLRVFR